jgi:acyl-CoA oxidase
MRKARASASFDTAECYADTSRGGLYEQGLHMGKACIEDMKKHYHDMFVWITPRYNLINAR